MQHSSLYGAVPTTEDEAYAALAAAWEEHMQRHAGCREAKQHDTPQGDTPLADSETKNV